MVRRIINFILKHFKKRLFGMKKQSPAIAFFKRESKKYLLDSKRWEELQNLAFKQNWKCVYSGDTLEPAKNMSLDHKLPKEKYPELTNDISNFQWVTIYVNRAKSDMPEEEFLQLCLRIVKNKGVK
jgi:hypothetical protein